MSDEIVRAIVARPTMPGKHGGTLNRGGGRRPPSETAEVKKLLRAGSKDAARKLLEKARRGEIKAIELVLAYGIGKPTDRVELSGPDGGPIEMVTGLTDHEKRALRRAIRAHLEQHAAEAATEAPA